MFSKKLHSKTIVVFGAIKTSDNCLSSIIIINTPLTKFLLFVCWDDFGHATGQTRRTFCGHSAFSNITRIHREARRIHVPSQTSYYFILRLGLIFSLLESWHLPIYICTLRSTQGSPRTTIYWTLQNYWKDDKKQKNHFRTWVYMRREICANCKRRSTIRKCTSHSALLINTNVTNALGKVWISLDPFTINYSYHQRQRFDTQRTKIIKLTNLMKH